MKIFPEAFHFCLMTMNCVCVARSLTRSSSSCFSQHRFVVKSAKHGVRIWRHQLYHNSVQAKCNVFWLVLTTDHSHCTISSTEIKCEPLSAMSDANQCRELRSTHKCIVARIEAFFFYFILFIIIQRKEAFNRIHENAAGRCAYDYMCYEWSNRSFERSISARICAMCQEYIRSAITDRFCHLWFGCILFSIFGARLRLR